MPRKRRRCKNPECTNTCNRKNRTGLCGECYRVFYQGERALSDPAAVEGNPELVIQWAERGDPFGPWRRVTGDCLLLNDLHIPLHHTPTIIRALKAAKLLGLKTAVLGGDVFEANDISRWPRESPGGMTVAESALRTVQVVGAIAAQFERIVIVKGNHDKRWQTLMEQAFQNSPILRTVEEMMGRPLSQDYRSRYLDFANHWTGKLGEVGQRIEWLPDPAVEIEGPPGLPPYLYCHPKIYSRLVPAAERKIWARFQQPILGTHGHLYGEALAPNGRDPVLEIPCATDYKRHLYLRENVTDHPQWVRGFATICRGLIKVWVDSPYKTDWAALEAAYARAAG